MFSPAFLERVGRLIHRGGAEDAEFTQRVSDLKFQISDFRSQISNLKSSAPPLRPLRLRGEKKSHHTQVGIKATGTAIALLLLSGLPCAARAQTNAAPAQTIQQPSAQPTPTQTPTPTPAPTPADGEAVERIESDAANLLLTAKDSKGRFVTTLRQEDLRVLEDGVEQQVSLFERETDAPVSLALLVDTSASQEKVLTDEQAAASAFVREVLRPGKDSASVLSFTGITRLDQPLTRDRERLLSAIARLKVEYTADNPVCRDENASEEEALRCRTGVWDAVVLSIQEVLSKTPQHTRRAIILLSDGDDTSSKLRIYQAVEYAVRNDTVVYSIGIRDKHFREGQLRRDFLRDISEQTGGRAFFPKDPEDLPAAFAQIEDELRSQYLISYTPTNRASDGSLRKVQVEITNPALRKEKLRLFYRQGYYARRKDEGRRGD
jgi:VWFA-related protein